MSLIQSCVECGNKFPAFSDKNTFCSYLCREFARKRRVTEDINNRWRHEKECISCGAPFVAKMAKQTCCSRKCIAKIGNKRRLKGFPREAKCLQCDNAFLQCKSDNYWCSAICRSRAHAKPSRRVIKSDFCRVCGELFQWSGARRKYCSEQCKQEAHRRQYHEKYKYTQQRPVKVWRCQQCNKDFTRSSHSFLKYCSTECRIKAHNTKAQAARQLVTELLENTIKRPQIVQSAALRFWGE